MSVKTRRTRWAAAIASAALVGAAAAAATPGVAAAGSGGTITYSVHPLTRQFSTGTPAALPVTSQCIAQVGLACYTPAQIRKAYDIPAGSTGAGMKIAIIDAYGSPTVRQDLHVFDTTFGLPDPVLNVYCPSGGCPTTVTAHSGQPLDWAGETSLDVQWAHAVAPDAEINLVVAPNNFGNALNVAVQYAVDNNLGDVLSMSYGAPEAAIAGKGNNSQLQQAHAIFQQAVSKGVSLFSSAGDDGATFGEPAPTANYPASDPLITSVGGTDLFASDSGAYQSEYTWNDSDPATCPFGCTDGVFGATGGAPSVVFPAPAYQKGVTGNPMRTVSDVSYDAGVYTAVWTYEGFNADPANNGFYFFGGTSSGSPQWAGIGALADKAAGHRLGQLNPLLYGIAGSSAGSADFHDVTVGNDALDGPGFPAGPGYDIPTGLGTPDVAHLIASLAGA
jgi:subtilase family serine protease